MANEGLKSIHITNYYHKNSGGISTAYNRLLEAANRHRRFVRLIVPGERDAQEEVGGYGRIYYVKANYSPLFDKRYRLMLPWKTYIFNETPIRRILREEQADIVEIGEKYSLSLLAGLIHKGFFKSLGRPMLVHFSCERMDDNLRAFVSGAKLFRWFARRFMGNYIFPMFDYHLANSNYTAQELLDSVDANKSQYRSDIFFNFCWRFFRASQLPAEERVFVNQCGVDNELFTVERKNEVTRREVLTEAGFPENATVLLYAGRISPEKNIKLLPKILRSLLKFYNLDSQRREYRLLIAGDGPKTDWLKQKLEQYAPGKFKILGYVADREKLADIYANADIFIHPNPREPFGIAPLEAMASGLPVIAPKSGGVLSYANDENAWLEEPASEDYFAAVQDILNNEERRVMKIKNALDIVREYTWENSTDRLFTLYDNIYKDFCLQRELHVYESENKKINFAEERVFNGKAAGLRLK
ncbi:MAG TPA: glycosyltransferase [Pyrinomonadaceae bacterium]|jgi:glycosyltransferase involved in cell wall biosynthesis